MPYQKLPNSFLKLPDLGNIDKKPEEPYDFPTLGMVHSSKFKGLCRAVLNKEKNIPQEILELFEGHRLEGVIDNIEFDQLADLIRHTLIINKDKIGWEVSDEIIYKLDKMYTPRWDLPDLAFDQGVREILITRVNWTPNDQMASVIQDFIQEYEVETGQILFYEDKFDPTNKKIWSFRELYVILHEVSHLISEYASKVDAEKYYPLIKQIFQLFEDSYRNKVYSIEQRTVLILLSVHGAILSRQIEVSKLKIQLDNSMNLINQLDKESSTSYRLLYSFIYSIFWYNLFISTSDLITQRDLVAEIIDDIYKPENMDLAEWKKFIISSKAHPITAAILFSGYEKLILMLFDYSKSLPECQQRQDLLEVADSLIYFTHDLLLEYLEDYFNIKLENNEFIRFFDEILLNINYMHFQRLIKSIIAYTMKYKIINSEELSKDEDLINGISYFYDRVFTGGIGLIHNLDLKIRSGNYNFEYHAEAIKKEFSDGHSVILSSTFENEIIRVIGVIFSSIQERTNQTTKINIEHYEIMILYTLEWMCQLYNDYSVRAEVIMILSPLISIAYIQLAKGFLEKNNLEGAFLSYFNSFYVMELVNQDLQGHSMSEKMTDKSISQKFQALVKEFGIEELSDEAYVKKLFRSIENSIIDRTKNREDKSFSMGGMLDDDIVIGYLDIITKLETFTRSVESINSIKDAIIDSEIYDPIPEDKKFTFDYYGDTLDSNLTQQFPFPIIRNIYASSVGVKLYPIELKLPDLLKFNQPK